MDDELIREIEKAEERGQALSASTPVALSARLDTATGRVVVELTDGRAYAFPPALSQDLAGASASDVSEIIVDGAGLNLNFPRLDADLFVPALIAGVFGTRDWMEQQYNRHAGAGLKTRLSGEEAGNGRSKTAK
jgi:Protein of unknown function (DUF2442)